MNTINTTRIAPFTGVADIFECIVSRADPLREGVPVTALAIAAHDGFGPPFYVVEWRDAGCRRLSYTTEISETD